MKTVEELNSKYAGYSTSQLKIFLIALLGDYTDPKTIKLRKDQINKGMHENVFEDYDMEIKVLLDLIHKKLIEEIST